MVSSFKKSIIRVKFVNLALFDLTSNLTRGALKTSGFSVFVSVVVFSIFIFKHTVFDFSK